MRIGLQLSSVVLALALASTAAAQDYPALDAYSSAEERKVWTESLASECIIVPEGIFFHPLGHLASLSADCPLPSPERSAILEWLLEHRLILGLGNDDRASFREEEPARFVSFRPDGTSEETGLTYTFDVIRDGLRYLDSSIEIHFSPEEHTIFGVFTSHGPAVGGCGEPVTCDPEKAWEVAQGALGSPAVVLSEEIGWFDPGWARERVPEHSEVHWKFHARSDEGADVTVYVRCADLTATLINGGETTWFAPQQYHYGWYYESSSHKGRLYWDNVTPNNANGCNALDYVSCTDPAFRQSLTSRDVAAKVPGAIYDATNHTYWPFPSPIDRENRPFVIAVAAGEIGPDVCHKNYPCIPYMTDAPNFAVGQLKIPVITHEYAHLFLSEGALGSDYLVGPNHAGQFTEAICDFFGFVAERKITGSTKFGPPAGLVDAHNGRVEWDASTDEMDHRAES